MNSAMNARSAASLAAFAAARDLATSGSMEGGLAFPGAAITGWAAAGFVGGAVTAGRALGGVPSGGLRELLVDGSGGSVECDGPASAANRGTGEAPACTRSASTNISKTRLRAHGTAGGFFTAGRRRDPPYGESPSLGVRVWK